VAVVVKITVIILTLIYINEYQNNHQYKKMVLHNYFNNNIFSKKNVILVEGMYKNRIICFENK